MTRVIVDSQAVRRILKGDDDSMALASLAGRELVATQKRLRDAEERVAELERELAEATGRVGSEWA